MPLIALATNIIQAVTFGLLHEILALIRKLYLHRPTKVLTHGGESGNNEKFQPGDSQEDLRLVNKNTGDCTSLESSCIPTRRSQDRSSLPVCFDARLCRAADNGNKNSKVVPLERHSLLDLASTHPVRLVHTHNGDEARQQLKSERRGSIMKTNLKYSSNTDEAQLNENVLKSDHCHLLHHHEHVYAHSSQAGSRWTIVLNNEIIEVHQARDICLNDGLLDIDQSEINPALSEPVRRFSVCFRSQDEIIDDLSHFKNDTSELGENEPKAGSTKQSQRLRRADQSLQLYRRGDESLRLERESNSYSAGKKKIVFDCKEHLQSAVVDDDQPTRSSTIPDIHSHSVSDVTSTDSSTGRNDRAMDKCTDSSNGASKDQRMQPNQVEVAALRRVTLSVRDRMVRRSSGQTLSPYQRSGMVGNSSHYPRSRSLDMVQASLSRSNEAVAYAS